ncbi:hypothetical protein C8J56DRAFT_883998 [Mycena floridula]|nr:hypothetical protein C8J56DRAFT_883998 [Mycena floridula]
MRDADEALDLQERVSRSRKKREMRISDEKVQETEKRQDKETDNKESRQSEPTKQRNAKTTKSRKTSTINTKEKETHLELSPTSSYTAFFRSSSSTPSEFYSPTPSKLDLDPRALWPGAPLTLKALVIPVPETVTSPIYGARLLESKFWPTAIKVPKGDSYTRAHSLCLTAMATTCFQLTAEFKAMPKKSLMFGRAWQWSCWVYFSLMAISEATAERMLDSCNSKVTTSNWRHWSNSQEILGLAIAWFVLGKRRKIIVHGRGQVWVVGITPSLFYMFYYISCNVLLIPISHMDFIKKDLSGKGLPPALVPALDQEILVKNGYLMDTERQRNMAIITFSMKLSGACYPVDIEFPCVLTGECGIVTSLVSFGNNYELRKLMKSSQIKAMQEKFGIWDNELKWWIDMNQWYWDTVQRVYLREWEASRKASGYYTTSDSLPANLSTETLVPAHN